MDIVYSVYGIVYPVYLMGPRLSHQRALVLFGWAALQQHTTVYFNDYLYVTHVEHTSFSYGSFPSYHSYDIYHNPWHREYNSIRNHTGLTGWSGYKPGFD